MTKFSKFIMAVIFKALLISTTLPAFSIDDQEYNGRIHFNLSIHAGTILPHNDMLIYLNRDYIQSMELNAWFVNRSSTERSNPALGPGYLFSNLGNREVFGHLHAVYMSLINPAGSGRLPIDVKANLGIGYVTKRYSVDDNYFNRGIGSHLNMYGQLSLTGRIAVAEEWIFRPGISFQHVSNGTIVSPNSGINMFTINAGMEFRSGHNHSGALAIDRDKKIEGRNRFTFTLAPGIKQMDRRIDTRIITSSLIANYGYMITPEISVGIGAALFFNDTWAWSPYAERDEDLPPFQSALHLSLQRDMGPLAFFLQPGSYLYMPAREIPYFTGRLGLRYKFQNNILAHFAIKHHWFAIADYFEWGIGYEFNR